MERLGEMSREKGFDEIFCRSCGEAIKKEAEICPHCGVRNEQNPRGSSDSYNHTSKSQGYSSDSSLNIDSDTIQYGLLALQWGLGILLLLAGLGTLGSGGGFIGLIISIFQAIFYIVIGALLIPPIREKISIEYSPSTFGRVQSVNQEIAHDSEVPCSACHSSVAKGISRTYKEQFVLFGVPLITFDEGKNTYCRNCANGEPATNIEKATN